MADPFSVPENNQTVPADGKPLEETYLPEEASAFEELVELAAMICGKPFSAMTMVRGDRLRVQAGVGIAAGTDVPLCDSACQYTVHSEGLLIIPDLHADSRFDELPHRDLRFYAGVSLRGSDGTALGALCVMDHEPSSMTEQQQRWLAILGRQISKHLQLRERAAALDRMARQEERNQQLFRSVLDNIPAEVYMKDRSGRLLFYNKHLCNRFGVSQTDWLGKTDYDLWPHDFAEMTEREEQYVLRSGNSSSRIVELPENGKSTYWKLMLAACQNAEGEPMLAGVALDLTGEMHREAETQRIQDELEEANRKLNSLALTDSLTGLWNRRAFDARLETTIIAAQRSKQCMALMLLDIDNFKAINDRFGHPFGDRVLRSMATILGRVKRADDIACRFGGEEFAILLPNSEMAGAVALAGRILEAMRLFAWEKETVTLSIGLALCAAGCSSDELVDHADNALYQAKREGKDRMVLYRDSDN